MGVANSCSLLQTFDIKHIKLAANASSLHIPQLWEPPLGVAACTQRQEPQTFGCTSHLHTQKQSSASSLELEELPFPPDPSLGGLLMLSIHTSTLEMWCVRQPGALLSQPPAGFIFANRESELLVGKAPCTVSPGTGSRANISVCPFRPG